MSANFPLQAKFIGYGSTLVVDFTDETTGTVVVADDNWEVGHYSYMWTSCLDVTHWEVIKQKESPEQIEASTN